MLTRPASPATSGLIAQLGALGGAVRTLLWLVRLMLRVGVSDRPQAPLAGLWTMLRRVATGKVPLRGFDVTEKSEMRGRLRVEIVHISMRGAPGEPAVFSATVETVTILNAAFLRPDASSQLVSVAINSVVRNFAKVQFAIPPRLALFVTVSKRVAVPQGGAWSGRLLLASGDISL